MRPFAIFIVSLLTLSSLSVFAKSSDFSGIDEYTPIADVNCQIDDESRERRIQMLNEEMILYADTAGAAINALSVAEKSLTDMKTGMAWADAANVVSTLAALYTGIAGIKAVFWSKQVVTLSIAGHTLTLPIAASQVVQSTKFTYTLGSAGLTAYLVTRGSNAEAATVTQSYAAQLKSLEEKPFFTPQAINFLSSPNCGPNECSIRQPELIAAWDRLNMFREQSLAILNEKDHWYLPEYYSQIFQKQLAEVEIPWANNAIELIGMNVSYARLLRQILLHDKVACEYIQNNFCGEY